METLAKLNPTRNTISAYILAIVFIVTFNPLKGSTNMFLEEDDPVLESWMTAPFESGAVEAELVIESWMTAPFGSSLQEPVIEVEPWMTVPFEAAEYIEIESWMIRVF